MRIGTWRWPLAAAVAVPAVTALPRAIARLRVMHAPLGALRVVLSVGQRDELCLVARHGVEAEPPAPNETKLLD